MKTLPVLALLTLFAYTSQAQKWQLVYHNDKDGETVTGNKDELIQAVRDGLPIRVAWWSQSEKDPKRKVEHVADAKFLTILSDEVVFAQIDPIYGQTPNFDDQEILLKENLQWVMIAGTNGKFESMMSNLVSGEIVGHGLRQYPFKWFIRKQD